MLKRTALYDAHRKLGARLVDFGGWEMPVQYTGIIQEHHAVREASGLFDISHMGEVAFSGPGAPAFLNHLLTNDVRKLAPGQGQYTLMCNERGGVVDDLYAYRLADTEYLLVINASRIQADLAWMRRQLAAWPDGSQVQMRDLSDELSAVALQGPRARAFVNTCFTGPSLRGTPAARVSDLTKNQLGVFRLAGDEVQVACTGYTGEDGFEIIAGNAHIEGIWNALLEAGAAFGCLPAGLGARDTLRTESCYPLYGHELDEDTTPIEAGVGFFVALDKGNFLGRETMARQKASGAAKKCVAFKMNGKGAPPRPHYPIWCVGQPVGQVTSGTQSPSLSIGIGLGYVPKDAAKAGDTIEIEIRGQRHPALVVPKPIYRKTTDSNSSDKK